MKLIPLILSTMIMCSSGEVFSSLGHMEDLIHGELNLIKALNEYISMEQSKLDFVKKLSKELEEKSLAIKNNIREYLSHPVNQFHLMKRLSGKWQAVLQAVHEDHGIFFFNKHFEKVRELLPSENDVKGTAQAIMRLQDTYMLTTHDLVTGSIKGYGADESMSLEEVFYIGVTAYSSNDFYHCALWMKEAKNMHLTGEKGPSLFEILDHFSYCSAQLGFLETAFTLTKDMLEIDPSHERTISNLHHYNIMLNSRKDGGTASGILEPKLPVFGSYKKSAEFLEYERLCRDGSDLVPPWKEKELNCYYWTNQNPWLLIQPIKAEMLWKGPDLVRYYEVISDKEIELIKSFAKPRLNRATVNNPNSGEVTPADYRVSKSGWLADNEFDVVKQISDRISTVTGLSVETAEDLQIANYGVGGQYEPHLDYASTIGKNKNSFKHEQGNRIATWLFYFSDVTHGGSTVFLFPKLAVKPVKGSAVFWYNLLPSGQGDERTRHGACPVLLGIKWAGNKWIHERGQEFHRKCGLTIDTESRV